MDCLATRKQREAADLVLLDDTGSNLAMARVSARAPRGQRAYATKPVNRGCHVTVLGALGLDGLVAPMTGDGFPNGDIFVAFLRAMLLPHLRPGQRIILDNLKARKVAGGRAACADAQVSLRSLPPYAPDVSPIEACWSQVKTSLRAQAARTREALEQALAAACETIPAHDAQGWFTHAGSCIAAN